MGLGFSGIQSGIVGVEGTNGDHQPEPDYLQMLSLRPNRTTTRENKIEGDIFFIQRSEGIDYN